jgi:hypothetical protein
MIHFVIAAVAAISSVVISGAIAASTALMATGQRGKGKGMGGNLQRTTRSNSTQRDHVPVAAAAPKKKLRASDSRPITASALKDQSNEALERELARCKSLQEQGQVDLSGALTLSLAPPPSIMRSLPDSSVQIPFSHLWHASAAASQPDQEHILILPQQAGISSDLSAAIPVPRQLIITMSR